MKTLTIHVPDDIAARLEQLITSQGDDYASVNSEDVTGGDALLLDLIVLGLDELTAGEDEFPDDIDD